MSSSPVVLFEAINPPATSTTVLCTVGVKTIVTKLTGANVSGSSMTVSVRVVGVGGAGSTVHTLVSARTLLAGESYGFPEIVGHVLPAGASLAVIPSTDGANFRGCGMQVTN